jgi:hypothetical protein
VVDTEPPDDELARRLLRDGWSITPTQSAAPRELWFELELTAGVNEPD